MPGKRTDETSRRKAGGMIMAVQDAKKERNLKKKTLPETNDALQEVSFKGSR